MEKGREQSKSSTLYQNDLETEMLTKYIKSFYFVKLKIGLTKNCKFRFCPKKFGTRTFRNKIFCVSQLFFSISVLFPAAPCFLLFLQSNLLLPGEWPLLYKNVAENLAGCLAKENPLDENLAKKKTTK